LTKKRFKSVNVVYNSDIIIFQELIISLISGDIYSFQTSLSYYIPSAFGFIDSNIESIEFYGKGEVTNENIANYENRTTGLSVNSGK